MGGRIRILVCLAVAGLALLGAGPALAQGGQTTTSAGDQQYIDPLSTTTSTHSAPTTPTTSTPAATSSTTPAASAPAPTTASQAPTTSTTPSASANTLPYTGLNLGLVIALGLGLLGGGLVMLRLARRA